MVQVNVENVDKYYASVHALNQVNLSFQSGSLTAILGPSGCGKTTLLRSLAGFLQVDEGRILFDQDDVTDLSPQTRGTAMVFQDYALWPHMTIFDNVAYGLRLRRVPKPEIQQRVKDAMALVELTTPEIMTRRPPQLSGGQQQRVALARALVVRPRVLLLDEPLSNLDAKVRQRLRVEIRRLQKRIGITTIYVTHDQEEALSLADTVIVMNQGVVMQAGAPRDIYQKPANRFVAEFLGVSNVLHGRASADGKEVSIGQTTVPAALPSGAPAIVIFKAEDAAIDGHTPPDAKTVVFHGHVDEVLFVGATYRHYVMVGDDQIVLVDNPTPTPDTQVAVAVPRDKIQVYPA